MPQLAWRLSPVFATEDTVSQLLAVTDGCHHQRWLRTDRRIGNSWWQGLDIGCGPTPMLYFAGVTLNDGAIQVTGSHNPPTHNGFKIVMNGQSFFGEDIQQLGAISAAGLMQADGGTVTQTAVFESYVARLLQRADAGGLSVVGIAAMARRSDNRSHCRQFSGDIRFYLLTRLFSQSPPKSSRSSNVGYFASGCCRIGAAIGIGFDGDATALVSLTPKAD